MFTEDLEAVLRLAIGVRDCLVVAYDSTAYPAPVAVLLPMLQTKFCRVLSMLRTANWRLSSKFVFGCVGRSLSIRGPRLLRFCAARCRAGRSSR